MQLDMMYPHTKFQEYMIYHYGDTFAQVISQSELLPRYHGNSDNNFNEK